MYKSKMSLLQRLIAVFIYILLVFILNGCITKVWLPSDGGDGLWLFSMIAMYFFTHLSAPFFVTPRDSLANASTAALMLATVNLSVVSQLFAELQVFRWMSFGFATVTSIAAITALIANELDGLGNSKYASLSRITFWISDNFGKGQVIFTPHILISIIGFYESSSVQQLWLLFVSAFLIFAEPIDLLLRVLTELRLFRGTGIEDKCVGEIKRIDDPNLIRVKLQSSDTWKRSVIHTVHLPNSRHVEVLPLFIQMQDAELIGTGLCHTESIAVDQPTIPGHVYVLENSSDEQCFIDDLCCGIIRSELVGFVVENSEIASIQFEVSSEIILKSGWVVYTKQENKPVFYQIIDARTKEEIFAQNPRGTQIVFAEQLGTLETEIGFKKYGWLPAMNSPVFMPSRTDDLDCITSMVEDTFRLGVVPNTNIAVTVDLADLVEYHTAILGVTGTGKTELTLDLIQYAIRHDTLVFCVDLTGEYRPRLSECNPVTLGLSENQLVDLQNRIFDVETGDFGGQKAKKPLAEYINSLQPYVASQVNEFLVNEDSGIGIFDIRQISNTQATLRTTELYLSAIFEWAKANRKRKRILLVLEEAHTIVPETNLFRYDKVETDAVLGRMSQIALQGRKYGVGLLLISQRTALVSKTLLSQCNTVISFAMHDATGISYLGSVFNTEYTRVLPNLKFLEGIAFGKAVNSERPIMFTVRFDESKKQASMTLDYHYMSNVNEYDRPDDEPEFDWDYIPNDPDWYTDFSEFNPSIPTD